VNEFLQFEFSSFQQKRAERVATLKTSTAELKKKLALKVSAIFQDEKMMLLDFI